MKKRNLKCKDCYKPLFVSGMSVSGELNKKYKFYLYYSCRDLNCRTHKDTYFISAQKIIKVTQDEWLLLFEKKEIEE